MVRLRIAVALHCFEMPLRQALLRVAETGATGIQIDARNDMKPADLTETGRRQFLHRLGELDLSVASVSFPTRSPLYETDRLEARLEATRAAMRFAFQLKARVVTVRLGRIPAPDAAEYDVLRNVLNDLARDANRIGVTPAVTLARDPAESLAKLLAEVDEGPIGVNFDPATCVMAGHDPPEVLRVLRSYLSHFQVRDAIRDIDGSGIEVPVGRGEVRWEEMLALADDADYRGWWTVDRTQGDDKAGDAGRAVRYLQQVALG